METLFDHMRDRLLVNVHAEEFWPDADQEPIDKKTMEDLQFNSAEWQHILMLMKNRMSFGGFRYGPTKTQKRGQFNDVEDVKRRLCLFQKTGNMEHLIDAANITVLACIKKDHPNFHFESTDDGEHAKKLK